MEHSLVTNGDFKPPLSSNLQHCTGCKCTESDAVTRCLDCDNFLCYNCMLAHQLMHYFEGHRVLNLEELQQNGGGKDDLKNDLVPSLGGNGPDMPVYCMRHKTEPVTYFCRTCNGPICMECALLYHPSGLHDYKHLSEIGPKELELMIQTMQEGKCKATDIQNTLKNLEHTTNRLQMQYHKAQNEINNSFHFYRSMIEKRKEELLEELQFVFSLKQISLNVLGQKAQETIEEIYSTCDFVDRVTKHATMAEALMFKGDFDSKFQAFMNYNPDFSLQSGCDLEFVSNYQAIQVGVRNTFGHVRSRSELPLGPSKQSPLSRPVNGTVHLNSDSALDGNSDGMNLAGVHRKINGVGLNGVLDRPYSNDLVSSASSSSPFESKIISERFSSANSLGQFSTTFSDLNLNGNGADYSLSSGDPGDSMLDRTSKLKSTAILPPISVMKRQEILYQYKFGDFGEMEGEFMNPNGDAVNDQSDIIVADTNNHRIQIFDMEGRFKFQFGECGKRSGQLMFPNRVAVVRAWGDIIVSERCPTHQIQIYNQYGEFVRKFEAKRLQHPRAVTVDNKGRVVVVECKVIRVIIFDQTGNVLQQFGCATHLQFPNGVVVNDKQEIFISDNRGHCVKVFNYDGMYLRQIGDKGIINYPIGVGINKAGEILIADNNNNFNVNKFTQDGQFVSALTSKAKHEKCLDVALMNDGSVVLACDDNRLYI